MVDTVRERNAKEALARVQAIADYYVTRGRVGDPEGYPAINMITGSQDLVENAETYTRRYQMDIHFEISVQAGAGEEAEQLINEAYGLIYQALFKNGADYQLNDGVEDLAEDLFEISFVTDPDFDSGYRRADATLTMGVQYAFRHGDPFTVA